MLILLDIRVRVLSFKLNNLYIDYIKTHSYHTCCTLKTGNHCLAPRYWYINCGEIFPQITLSVIYHITAPTLLLLSGVSLTIQIYKLNIRKFSKQAFTISIVFINILDISYGTYISVLIIVDKLYQDTFGSFKTYWRTGTVCKILSTIVQNYCILSPCLVCFIALKRLMVVLYPLKSRLIDGTFVLTSMSILHIISFSLSCYWTFMIQQKDSESLSNDICFPLGGHSNLQGKVNTYFIITLQTITTLLVPLFYFIMFSKIYKSEQKLKKTNSKRKALKISVLLVVVCCVLCWTTSSSIYASTVVLDKYPISLIPWTVVLVIPINSLVNPIAFLFSFKKGGRVKF